MSTVYGHWTILETFFFNRHTRARAICGGCAREFVIRFDQARDGKSSSCKGCSHKYRVPKPPGYAAPVRVPRTRLCSANQDCVVVSPEWACHDTAKLLKEIGATRGVSRQAVEQFTKRALKQAQVSMLASLLGQAMPDESDDYVSDLVAFAVVSRLGRDLVLGELTLDELKAEHAESLAESRKVAA